MSGYRAGKPSWVDPGFYPVRERLVEGARPGASEVFLVDVGGGLGHDLELLTKSYPDLPGKLILQDQRGSIDQVSAPNAVFEKTVHDFFTPQPIEGEWTALRRFFKQQSHRDEAYETLVQVLVLTTCIRCCTIGTMRPAHPFSRTSFLGCRRAIPRY